MYPKNRLVIIANFAHIYQAKEVLYALQECRIAPTKGVISHPTTLIIELQGIKDIIQLEALFVESICRENNALTVDIITAQKMCEQLLQQTQ